MNVARDELINTLCENLSNHIMDGFNSIIEDASNLCKKNRIPFKEQVQICMKDILHWEKDIIISETTRILTQFPSIRKILKMITIANIKILSTFEYYEVELDDRYVSKKTPNLREFVHRVYINSAKEFFHCPDVLLSKVYKDRHRQFEVVVNVIRKVLNDYMPLDDMLSKLNIDDDDDQEEQVEMETGTTETETETEPMDIVKEDESEGSSCLSEEETIRSKSIKSFF